MMVLPLPLLLLGSSAAIASANPPSPAPAPRGPGSAPHIIFLLVDDLGPDSRAGRAAILSSKTTLPYRRHFPA